jgi:hypothetical protein
MTEPHAATPASSTSTAITRFNALRHGVLSRYTVLPWEDREEYQVLLTALVAVYDGLRECGGLFIFEERLTIQHQTPSQNLPRSGIAVTPG